MDRLEVLAGAAKGKTLDVGFNPNYTALHDVLVKKLGQKNVIAIDTVVRKPTKYLLKASAERMPFKKAEFDSVVAGELIEHLKEPGAFVKESARVLKQGGLLALSTPNKKSWANRLTRSYEAPLHFSLFSIQKLTGLLERHGFEILEMKMFPYTAESSEGSQHKWFMPVRKFVHYIVPFSLKENMVFIARLSEK